MGFKITITMAKFRKKLFTIPEGHYTGPKDIDKVPGVLEMVGKSALGGAGIGAVVGAIMKDSSVLNGAITGAKYGSITGLVLKFFLNYLHNPMTSIKFQDIDRNIRREFGIYRMQGITVGDTVSKRATVDEKFSTNDRNVSNYKINFAIQNNQVIMYTLGMTDKELEKTSNILDYYCKKYFGMEYTATPINAKINSYSVSIVFTNYQVISNFMMELSNELQCKINLLDNKAIVDRRISEAANLKNNSTDIDEEVEEERDFSVKPINKYDLISIIGKSGVVGLSVGLRKGIGKGISSAIQGLLKYSIKNIGEDTIAKTVGKNGGLARKMYNNSFLEDLLQRLHYIEGHSYTVGQGGSDINISLISGLFLMTVTKRPDLIDEIDKKVYGKNKTGINRTDTGKAVVYTYPLVSINEFEYLLKRLISTGLVPNIFEG